MYTNKATILSQKLEKKKYNKNRNFVQVLSLQIIGLAFCAARNCCTTLLRHKDLYSKKNY